MQQLETFTGLARWGKQTALTAALGKSQSQISRDLTALERALGGVTLFDRAKRRPTAAGVRVDTYARTTLDGWKDLRRELQEAAAHGALSMAVDPDLGAALLPLLGVWQQRQPHVRLNLLPAGPAEAHEALRTGRADVAAFSAPDHCPGVRLHAFAQVELFAVYRPDRKASWRDKKRLTLSCLRRERLLLSAGPSSLSERLSDIHPVENLVHIPGGRQDLVQAAQLGLGVALVPVFPALGDVLLRDAPDVIERQRVAFEMPPYSLAIRAGQPGGGAISTLLRMLLRATQL